MNLHISRLTLVLSLSIASIVAVNLLQRIKLIEERDVIKEAEAIIRWAQNSNPFNPAIKEIERSWSNENYKGPNARWLDIILGVISSP